MSQPIENLRKRHRLCESCVYSSHWYSGGPKHCFTCLDAWPCDTIAALDALEEGLHNLLDARPSRGQLVARLDAATVLIRQAMKERHTTFLPASVGDAYWLRKVRLCGSPIAVSIDTCENCRPYREWLAGDKEAGNGID